jgi:EAL and modified HD-GYP domain-containing signal transduction protein
MLIYLGCDAIRRFVTVAALANMGVAGVSEWYHLSMVRGKFCELSPPDRTRIITL